MKKILVAAAIVIGSCSLALAQGGGAGAGAGGGAAGGASAGSSGGAGSDVNPSKAGQKPGIAKPKKKRRHR